MNPQEPNTAKTPTEGPGVVPGCPDEWGHTERTASPDRSADCGEPPVGSERGSQPSPAGVTVNAASRRPAWLDDPEVLWEMEAEEADRIVREWEDEDARRANRDPDLFVEERAA